LYFAPKSELMRKPLIEPKEITIPTHDWGTSPEAFLKLLFLYLDGNFHTGKRWHFKFVPTHIVELTSGYYEGEDVKFELSRYGVDEYEESDVSIIADMQAEARELRFFWYTSYVCRIDCNIIDLKGKVFPMRVYVVEGDAELVAIINGYAGDCTAKIFMMDNETTGNYEPHGDVYTKEIAVNNNNYDQCEKGRSYGRNVREVIPEELFDSMYEKLEEGKFKVKRRIKRITETLRTCSFNEEAVFEVSKVTHYDLQGLKLSEEIILCIAAFLPPQVFVSVRLGASERSSKYLLHANG
ncbi:hypothetical protein HK098_006069, partial [Nowakowskiella sp. JEL0407]